MEELLNGFKVLSEFIVWPYLAIFVLLSTVVKKAFGDLLVKITKFKWKPVFTVLTLATLIGILYLVFVKDTDWEKILVTYAIGTTFYETIFEFIESKLKKK